MFIYTALGDSITEGASASARGRAYPHRTAEELAKQGKPATVNVLAESGWTSRNLTEATLSLSSVPLKRSNAISIWVGGNDIAYAGLAIFRGAPQSMIPHAIERYARNLNVLVGAIREVNSSRLVLCTQYNPFPNSPLSGEAVSALNAVTVKTAKRFQAGIAPTEAWFAGREAELIAGYRSGRYEDVLTSPRPPIHPNDAGHALIAARLAPLLRPSAVPSSHRMRARPRRGRRRGGR